MKPTTGMQLTKLFLFSLLIVFTSAQKDDDANEESTVSAIDPCLDVKCKLGEVCEEGSCVCQSHCPSEWNNYQRQLCVDGTTYRHECDLWRNQCYCRTGDKRCGSSEFNEHKADANAIIKYYDECRDLNNLCDWAQEETTFSARLALWFQALLNHKWSVSSGQSEDDSLLRPMGTKARSATSKLFSQSGTNSKVNGGILSYWFCEMDRDNSGGLSTRETSRLYQLLLPSAPCLDVFMGLCSSSGTISIDQWHNCFQVPTDERMDCSNFK